MVTAIVLEDDPVEDLAIAALLHDGPEDQGGKPTLMLIKEQFGPRVAEIVLECSDSNIKSSDQQPDPVNNIS